jgi:hypothetical protein
VKRIVSSLLKSRKFACLLACLVLSGSVSSAAQLDVQLYKKKDPGIVIWNMMMPGSSVEGEHVWVEYTPNTVWKTYSDGSIWFHDCDNQASITIGTGEDTAEPPTTVFYQGTGTISIVGSWVKVAEGMYVPGDKMSLKIVTRVTDPLTGEVSQFIYNALVRGGVWDEKFHFEPLGKP